VIVLKEVVLATRNRHKGEEFTALLADFGICIRTLDDFPGVHEVDEDGTTCEANAIKKATEMAQATGLPAVADDTGLEVDALGGRPGVYAARYAGEHASYEDNCKKLLRELSGLPMPQRSAAFVTVAAIALPSGEVQVTDGRLEGLITETATGLAGFGYDPVFFLPELGKTLAELTPREKNRISHRAKAFAKAKEILRSFNSASNVGA